MVARQSAMALALWLGACSSSDEIDNQRSIGPAHHSESKQTAQRLFASSAERFGMSMPGPASAAPFTFTTPPGWNELPPTELRALNFRIGESAEDECSVTLLGGDGGGALANVNRWCGQVGASAWNQAQLDAAPRIAMFGSEALIVMLGDEGAKRSMLGALARLDGRSVFVKLAGRRETILAQRPAFESFCTSLAKKP